MSKGAAKNQILFPLVTDVCLSLAQADLQMAFSAEARALLYREVAGVILFSSNLLLSVEQKQVPEHLPKNLRKVFNIL